MAQEYPTSSNPWSEYLSPRAKLNSSSFNRVLSSPIALTLLTDNFNQQVDTAYKQSHTCRFVCLCERIDDLLTELFNLKQTYQHLEAMKEIYKFISKDRLNEYLNALDELTKLFSNLSEQKDLINSIIAMETKNSDFYLHPSIHEPLQELLSDIQKYITAVNCLKIDLTQIQALSKEKNILLNLQEITCYIDDCVDNYNSTYTKITNLTHLV
ncbi:hypothetical protein LOD99_3415 [Oopsacas minuta]|uniref:Uncharacterized protein n=1 Tax=Oopsacas minuta TaxID=111878 RepID=A0AAV7JXI1_9METZ|nr:hypothetical protein LOD99_3415 [Oopsacas minuta]